MGDDDRSGPSTGWVIAGTLVAAAAVAAATIGIVAVVGDDGEAATATTIAASVETTERVLDAGQFAIRRVTNEGIELRVTRSEGGWAVAPDPGFDTVAPTTVPAGSAATTDTAPATTVDPRDADGNGRPDVCDPVGDASGWAIDDAAILQGSTPITTGRIGGFYPQPFWGAPDVTMAVVIGQVDDDVELVSLRSADGRVDEMAPVGGLFLLALRIPPEDQAGAPANGDGGLGWVDRYTATARHGDGRTETVSGRGFVEGHPAWSGVGECAVPPDVIGDQPPAPVFTLPPAGEQPADPAAARAEIEANFGSLYGGGTDAAARLAVIDDPYGLEDVLARIADGSVAERAGASSVELSDLVFTSPTEAFFTYTLTVPDLGFGDQQGRARLLDGVWKITRATYCQDLMKAGEVCPP